MAVVKVWSGVGHCGGCTATAALSFEVPEGVFAAFPRAIICPICHHSIQLISSYVIRNTEDEKVENAP